MSVWIGARELSIAESDSWNWRWNYLQDAGVEVAELVDICWLCIAGKIDTKCLTTKTSFGAYLVFKLTDDHWGLERAIASVRFAKEKIGKEGYTVFISKTKRRGENGRFPHLRTDGWMEIKLGQFINNLGEDGEVEMRLMETNGHKWKSGLIVKGIDIRPNSSKNSSSVSFAVLREDIVNLLDFIKRLKNEEDQIEKLKFVTSCLQLCCCISYEVDDQIEELKLELTFMTSCLQLCYYIEDEMSCITSEVHDLVQSLFHQSGYDDMLAILKDHLFPRLVENIINPNISDQPSESSAVMTEGQLVELLDALLVNLNYLPKDRAELIFPSMTQYEFLQNIFGNLRDFLGLIVNGCIERETTEYVLPQFQLLAERVGQFCFVLLPYQLDKDYILEFSRVNSKLVNLLVEVIPVELEVMKASKSADVGCFIKHLQEDCPDILTTMASTKCRRK